VVIDNANALLTKTKRALEEARVTLEALAEYQHPKLDMRAPYHHDKGNRDATRPADVIRVEVARINALLGDRA
jgi:hypothetical protein